MKTRLSFVSNSSTSSFIMYGINVSKEEFCQYVGKKNGKTPEDIETILENYGEIYLPKNDKMQIVVDYESDYFVVGRSYDSIGDDETGKMFKESVKKEFKEHFTNKKPIHLEFEICS